MESYVLNDTTYNFKPLEIFTPDANYQADERELEKSIQKNKEIIARVRNKRNKGENRCG